MPEIAPSAAPRTPQGTLTPQGMLTPQGQLTPQGTLTLQTVAFPADANASGDIFGGWVVGQMDIAAGTTAALRAQGRVATVAINAMRFHAPVLVGDLFTCYTRILKTGTTSITIHVEAWVRRLRTGEHLRVTEAEFTFVAIAESGIKRPLPPEGTPGV